MKKKIHALEFSKLLESIFCLLLGVDVFSVQKAVKMLEEVVVDWQEVRWKWLKRKNFVAQFIQLLKHWLCDMPLGIVMGKNWTLSVDQCRLQALQFLVHLVDVLSILLRGNGFTRIQKAVTDQNGSRLPVTMTFFLVQVCFEKCLELLLDDHWAGNRQLTTFCRMSQSNQEMVDSCCVE